MLEVKVRGYWNYEAWGVSSSGKHVDLDSLSKTKYHEHTYFEVIEYLDGYGLDVAWEIIFLVVLAINIIFAVLALIPNLKVLNKLFFAAIPLAALVVFIVVWRDLNTIRVLDIESLGTVLGYRVNAESTIRYVKEPLTMIPFMITCGLAFIFALVVGIMDLVAAKKERAPKPAYAAPGAYAQPMNYGAPQQPMNYGAPQQPMNYGVPQRPMNYGVPQQPVYPPANDPTQEN